MLDIKHLRNHLDEVCLALKKKGYVLDVEAFHRLDGQRKISDVETQSLLAKRKQASKQVGDLIKQGVSVDEAKVQVKETLDQIDLSLADLKSRAHVVESELRDFLLDIPNIPDASVPIGQSEEDNLEVSRWGEPKEFAFEVSDHQSLGEQVGGLDQEIAAQMTGSRFAVLKGGVAKLHRALAQFMLDRHTEENGYLEVNVPVIVNEESLTATGQLPKFAEDLFRLSVDNPYYLIPTAEVPVTNLVRDKIIDAKHLPLKFVAHTLCFRSEAGSHGRDTRGLIRQHQFEKVELVTMVKAADSEKMLETLTGHAESILQALELPYRKVILCGGDLSFTARKTYDLEVWLPAQHAYREISSCSNFGDYQARRLQARWRDANQQKPELLHTLNGSGLAVGRTLVAVLENYQNEDGTIRIPEVLQPYMLGKTILS